MSRIPRQAKRDGNEPEIVDALEAQGFSVGRINGEGIPDLVVGKGKFLALVEIKQPKKKHTEAQVKFLARWRGPQPITIRTLEDVARFALLAMETP